MVAKAFLVNAVGYRHAHREIARLLNERAAEGDAVALMDVGMTRLGTRTGCASSTSRA